MEEYFSISQKSLVDSEFGSKRCLMSFPPAMLSCLLVLPLFRFLFRHACQSNFMGVFLVHFYDKISYNKSSVTLNFTHFLSSSSVRIPETQVQELNCRCISRDSKLILLSEFTFLYLLSPFKYYILTTVSSTSSPLSHSPYHLPTPPLFSFRKWQYSQGYQPNIAYQVTLRLSMPPCIKAGQVEPVGVKGYRKRAKGQRQALLPLLGISEEDQATQA